jgi:hypothetical protein
VDVLGHAADVWRSKSHEFLSCSAATAMILPIADDLVLRIKAWGMTVDSCLASAVSPSQRTPYTVLDVPRVSARRRFPRARVGLRELDGLVRKASGNTGSLHSPQG